MWVLVACRRSARACARARVSVCECVCASPCACVCVFMFFVYLLLRFIVRAWLVRACEFVRAFVVPLLVSCVFFAEELPRAPGRSSTQWPPLPGPLPRPRAQHRRAPCSPRSERWRSERQGKGKAQLIRRNEVSQLWHLLSWRTGQPWLHTRRWRTSGSSSSRSQCMSLSCSGSIYPLPCFPIGQEMAAVTLPQWR